MMPADGAFNPARLVRAFERSGELRTVLLDFWTYFVEVPPSGSLA